MEIKTNADFEALNFKPVKVKLTSEEEMKLRKLGISAFIPPAHFWGQKHCKHHFRKTITKDFREMSKNNDTRGK